MVTARLSVFCAALLLVTAVGALQACGHPASQQECEAIFRRSAELTLRERNVTDQAQIDKRVAEVRAAEGDALLKKCVGKRITRGAMDCVRAATSKKALEVCLQ
jgi:hypothetical protein